MYNPVSTYRIQFNKEFTLQHLAKLVPYFSKLGVRTIYASPIFKAVPGSMHGYDVVNPYVINPEIGTEQELRDVIGSLKREGIGWIQDIVPNHMAFHHTNEWLMDVMEKGSMSVYSNFFDITWAGDFFHARLMAPFLGSPLEEAIAEKALQLVYEVDRLYLHYGDQFYPINSRTYELILKDLDNEDVPFQSIAQFLSQLNEIHQIDDPIQYAFRKHEIELQFESLMRQAETKEYIDACVERINQDDALMKAVADNQFYQLCEWRETNTRINYRRFFLVNGLICVNIQSEQVFAQYHRTVKSFIDQGLFQGLRIDHIDGLYDAEEYCIRLRKLTGPDCYIVVEKILEHNEKLPKHWPIQGTTGYDFLAIVNNLFTRNKAEHKFSAFYASLSGDRKPIARAVEEKKSAILYQYMGGELENLFRFFMDKNLIRESAEVKGEEVKAAIAEFLIHCPLYRMYGNAFPLEESEQADIELIFKKARERSPALQKPLDLLRDVLVRNPSSDSEYNSRVLQFYQRCMQFTGPLMAKGVEDTLMYTYNRFLAHNEVGDSLGVFGLTVDEFHQRMEERQQSWSLTQNTTSTHDTKRGEDVRMRLNVLPDLVDEWITRVQDWMRLSTRYKDHDAPSVNDEYFIYQTLVGAFPTKSGDDFLPRLKEYFTKAFREAKSNTDWADPDEHYEKAVTEFVEKLLQDNEFLSGFVPFQKKVADHGMINSLSQLILKFTCPGVPDVYQGTGNWDLSLVDPDNRKLVDYDACKRDLANITDDEPADDRLHRLWKTRADGRIKLFFLHKLLQLRKDDPELFKNGHYIPLQIRGSRVDNCIAFARRNRGNWIICVVPLNIGRLSTSEGDRIVMDWKDTMLVLPVEAPFTWSEVITEKSGTHGGEISLADLLTDMPFAILKLQEPPSDRSAGVLLPLASLPSLTGIGDMGISARNFVDSLSRARQQIWQLLPLNATHQRVGYSPYSAYSGMAGNTLLISLDDLSDMKLLSRREVLVHAQKNESRINYSTAEKSKRTLLNIAWSRFKHKMFSSWQDEFDTFIKREHNWLEDFAYFELLKGIYEDKPWYEWPLAIRERKKEALADLSGTHEDELQKIKWLQFIFSFQWNALREYCHTRNLKLLGDLPFYVSLDSADVWANRKYFSVNDRGEMLGVAGVPPDYFSADGQLWGMPVFHWDVLKADGYEWWVKRIARNFQLYDMLRLDHFRAFSEYWEVSGKEITAVNGKWQAGPGIDFFNTMKNQLGELPFVAEDLGEITPGVFALRDALGLPGMKVLQFAFGKDISESLHIPHRYSDNFFVYTGTHDNNTTRGWFRNDIGEQEKANLEMYTGGDVTERTIADHLIRLAYTSVAKAVIIPMQDILNLNEKARTNTPSSLKGNWQWRMTQPLDHEFELTFSRMTRACGR